MRRLKAAAVAAAILAGGYFGLAEWHLHRTRTLLADRRPDQALIWLARLDSFRSGTGESCFLRARAYRRQGKMNLMRTSLEKAWKLGFNTEKLEREQRLAMAQVGRLQESLPHLPAMLADPQGDASEICESYISGYLATYQIDLANELLAGWIADCPDDAQAYYVKGRFEDVVSNHREAVKAYQAAVEKAPHRTDLRLQYAKSLAIVHEYDQAGEQFQVLLRESPDDAETLRGWAECLVETARGDEARGVFQKVLEFVPGDEASLIGLARLEFQQGQYNVSLQLLKKLHERSSEKPEVRYLLGQVLRSLGRKDEARSHLEFYRDAEEARRKVAQLMDKVRQSPSDPELRFEIGATLMKYGQLSDGVGWLRSVLEFVPDHRQTHEALLAYYTEEGLSELAKRHQSALARLNRSTKES